jgi:hypothetical protein
MPQGVFFAVWLLMMIGMVVGYIIFLVAIWRAMIAHESIAGSLRKLAEPGSQGAPGWGKS